MNTSLYVGLSRQMTLQRALDIAANNIANVDTAGFKVEEQMVRQDLAVPPATPGASPIAYVLDEGVARNFSQGALEETGNPLDLAIEGLGFLQVQTDAGPRYTRDGRLGIIAGDRSFNPLFWSWIKGPNDGKVSVASARLEGMSDFLVLHHSHTWLQWRRETIHQVRTFLRTGRFDHSAHPGILSPNR